MEEKIKRKRGRKGKKREWMMSVGLLSYLIGLLIRIPLGRMIGDKGMGFFAAGMEFCLLVSMILSYGLSRAVTIQVKYRIKRQMYKSARRVYHSALMLATVISILAAVGSMVLAETIAQTVVLEQLGYFSIAAMAPAVCLWTVVGVMRGYFQGMGAMLPTVHSRFLEKFIMLAASLMAASMMYAYGIKVANLLKNTEYAAAYGAMGAGIGVSVAALFALLHLLFMHIVYAGTFKQQIQSDTSKHTESDGQIISILLTTSLPYMLCVLLYNMNYLIDQRVFNYVMNKKEQGSMRAAHWGIYYGKYSVITGSLAIVCVLTVLGRIPRMVQLHERQERREAQSELGRMMHCLSVFAVPCAVWTAVLAPAIAAVFFKGDNEIAVRLLQAGSFLIVLFAFSYLFMNILQRIQKIKIVIFAGFAAFAAHLLVLLVLIYSTGLGITAVACAAMVFWLVVCIVGFMSVGRSMQFVPDWLRMLGIPVICACASGLAGMLMNKLLLEKAGGLVTLMIGVLVCLIVYNVLLLVLHGVQEEELMEMPGGRIVIALAEKIHLI